MLLNPAIYQSLALVRDGVKLHILPAKCLPMLTAAAIQTLYRQYATVLSCSQLSHPWQTCIQQSFLCDEGFPTPTFMREVRASGRASVLLQPRRRQSWSLIRHQLARALQIISLSVFRTKNDDLMFLCAELASGRRGYWCDARSSVGSVWAANASFRRRTFTDTFIHIYYVCRMLQNGLLDLTKRDPNPWW
jgi:hypothetical protein